MDTETPEERRARLKALREKAKGGGGDAPVRFRNYLPADESLKDKVLPSTVMRKAVITTDDGGKKKGGDGSGKGGGDSTNVARPPPQRPDQEAAGGGKEEEEEDAIKRELRKHMEENDEEKLLLAPRKPNWDLKRDVAKKMAKMDKMTKRAIVEMLKEKLANQPEEDDDDDDEEDGE